MNGWFKFHRKLWTSNSPLFRGRNKTNKIVIWLWMMSFADDTGKVTFGRKQVANDTGLSEQQVQRVTKFWSKEAISETIIKTNNQYSELLILNWHKHQDKAINKAINEKSISDQQPITNKNKNKEYKNTTTAVDDKTLKICLRLGIEPTDTINEYVTKDFAGYSFKELTDTLIQWCEENNKKPSGLRWMNWVRMWAKDGRLVRK